MKRILFRADAAPHIGIGDLMSFLNLSNIFKNWETYFIIKDYKVAIKLMKKYNYKNIYFIDQEISMCDEVNYINEVIKENSIFSFFLQINENKLSLYNDVNVRFRACAYFDFDLPKNYDVVLSWNYNSKNYFNQKRHKRTKFFLGTEYVVLPQNFNFQEIENRKYKKKKEKLLISMGGADEKNLTLKVIKNLHKIDLKYYLTIILGSGYEFERVLLEFLKNTNISYEIKKSVDNMYIEYMNCDIAIGAGGLTVSELIATKTPAIIVSAYKHQIKRCNHFDEKGWIKHLGYMNTEFDNENFNFIPDNLNRFNSKILELVDYFNEVYK